MPDWLQKAFVRLLDPVVTGLVRTGVHPNVISTAGFVITLAAALHYAGYRQVVATLWSVYDPTAADVAESIYTELCADGQSTAGTAAALHRVVRRLRDQHPASPSVWTPFVHLGP